MAPAPATQAAETPRARQTSESTDQSQEGNLPWRRLSLQWVEAQQPGLRQQEAAVAQPQRAGLAGAQLQQRALLPPSIAASPAVTRHWQWPQGLEGSHSAPQYVSPFAEAAVAGFGKGSDGGGGAAGVDA